MKRTLLLLLVLGFGMTACRAPHSAPTVRCRTCWRKVPILPSDPTYRPICTRCWINGK